MSIAYGAGSASAPMPRKSKGGQAPIMRHSCYVCVARRGYKMVGKRRVLIAETDWNDSNRDIRRMLHALSAEHVQTVPADASERVFKWLDWYRVSLKEFTLETVRSACETAGIHSGPYWGIGRELACGGSGSLVVGRASPRKAIVRELERAGNVGALIATVFGQSVILDCPDTYPDVSRHLMEALHLSPTLPYSPTGKLYPEEWEPLGKEEWNYIGGRYNAFPQLFTHIVRHGTMRQLRIVRAWVNSMLPARLKRPEDRELDYVTPHVLRAGKPVSQRKSKRGTAPPVVRTEPGLILSASPAGLNYSEWQENGLGI